MNKDEFLTHTKNARNYYTHYDKHLEKKLPDFHTLASITNKLNLLMYYFIFNELGFDDDWILGKLCRKFRL